MTWVPVLLFAAMVAVLVVGCCVAAWRLHREEAVLDVEWCECEYAHWEGDHFLHCDQWIEPSEAHHIVTPIDLPAEEGMVSGLMGAEVVATYCAEHCEGGCDKEPICTLNAAKRGA